VNEIDMSDVVIIDNAMFHSRTVHGHGGTALIKRAHIHVSHLT
jgi:hypothetical protein